MKTLETLREQPPLNEVARQLSCTETFVGVVNLISFEEHISKKDALIIVISECETLGINPPIKKYSSFIDAQVRVF